MRRSSAYRRGFLISSVLKRLSSRTEPPRFLILFFIVHLNIDPMKSKAYN